MDLHDYKIGSLLRLDIFGDDSRLIDNDFVSQFEEAIDGDNAYIAAPIVEGVVYAVRVGWRVTVYMQEGNNFYRFFARVTQRLQQDGRPVLRIAKTSDIDVAQRRQYYRFKCSIPLRYRVISQYRKNGDPDFVFGKTADISGSGLCFTAEEQIGVDSLIECELTIDGKTLYLVGQIRRCDRKMISELEQFVYDVGVLFSEIEEQKRDLIIKYIFNEERRMRRIRIA